MCADKLDHAWDSLRQYGVFPDNDDVPELEEDSDETAEHGVCTVCGGDAFKLGAMGKLDYYQCIHCGSTMAPFAIDGEEDEDR